MVPEPLREPRAQAPFPEIPGYRLEAIIGRGATGVVYRAVQLAVDRVVALKVLHPELAGSKAVKRLQREARTTARLAHPGIVSAIDMGQVNGVWWYAMELIDGPSLAARLKEEKRLAEREVLKLFIPLCEALQHAADHGVVHRDIKPANILIDSGGRARLVDLGLAVTEDDPLLTKSGGTLGTPHYVSPEQARNPQSADVRSDIWSLGASMFHAACGTPPFAGTSVAEILSGVLYARIPDPAELEPSLSKGFVLVLRKCLARNPERRYQLPSELLADLEAIRERRAVTVVRSALDPLHGAAERKRRWYYAAGTAAALLAGVGIFSWQRWLAEQKEAPSTAGVPAYFEPLEEIRLRAQSNKKMLAGSLADIDELLAREGDSESFKNAAHALRKEVQQRYDAAVTAFQQQLSTDLDRALNQERDYVRAEELVAMVPDRLQQELVLNRLQLQRELERLDLTKRRQQVADDKAAALTRLQQQVNQHYDKAVLLKVKNLRDEGRWKSALAELRRPVRERLAESGISTRGLPEPEVDSVVRAVENLKVESEITELREAWRDADAALRQYVVRRSGELEAALVERAHVGDPADTLRAEVRRYLSQVPLVEGEGLDDVARTGLDQLAESTEKLAALERELEGKDARDKLAELRIQNSTWWRERRYTAIADDWREQRAVEWLAPVEREMERELEEAELLQAFLERAASALKPGAPASVLVGTIEDRGTVVAPIDVLSAGFRLRDSSGREGQLYALRAVERALLLTPDAIERLAGLPADPAKIVEPKERLVRALFRAREGDLDTAMKTFDSGPLPREQHPELVAQLEREVGEKRSERDARLAQRKVEAETLFNLIQRERSYANASEKNLKRVNQLLQDFGDLPFVQEQADKLRELRTQLSSPARPTRETAMREAFAPTRLSFAENNRVKLEFEFGADGPSKWTHGDWDQLAEGWKAARGHARDDLSKEVWPRLHLSQPLDLEAPMTVELDLEQPHDSGPPRRLFVSVAGVHVGFAGATERQSALLAVAAGGADEWNKMADDLEAGKGITVEAVDGLKRGKRHTLRVELTSDRGKVVVSLDGVKLFEQVHPSPEGKDGSASIVVRSIEPVLLRAVRIDAATK